MLPNVADMAAARGIPVHGAAIKAIREAKGWNQSTFASLAQVSSGYLCNIEAERKKTASPEVVRRIADLLQVPLAAVTSPHYVIDEPVSA